MTLHNDPDAAAYIPFQTVPEADLPTPDDILRQLVPEDPTEVGVPHFITPGDLAYAWTAFLSMFEHWGARLRTGHGDPHQAFLMPPPKDGDFFTDLDTGNVWVHAGHTWRLVTTVGNPLEVGTEPATAHHFPNAPADGDVYYDELRAMLWGFDAGSGWHKIGSGPSRVFSLGLRGQTPDNLPALDQVRLGVGDIVVNVADGNSWVLRDNEPGARVWLHLGNAQAHKEPKDEITVTGVTGQDPMTNPPPSFLMGHLYVNLADRRTWFFGDDGTGTVRWVETTNPVVTVSEVAAIEPATYTPALDPHVGDLFINRVDHKSWVYAPDPANAGAFVWEPLGSAATFDGDALLGQRNVLPWDATAIYPAGTLVIQAGRVYIAREDTSPNQDPRVDPIWRAVSLVDMPELRWPPAPDWSNTAPYMKGEMAWFGGQLFRALAAIPSGTKPPRPTAYPAQPGETFTGYYWRHTTTGSTTGFQFTQAGSAGTLIDRTQFANGDRVVFYWTDPQGRTWGDAYTLIPPLGMTEANGIMQGITGIRTTAPGAVGTIQQGALLNNPGVPANAIAPIIEQFQVRVFHQGQAVGAAPDPTADPTRWALVSGDSDPTVLIFQPADEYKTGDLVWADGGLWFALADRAANGETPLDFGQTTWVPAERAQVHHATATTMWDHPAKVGDFYIDTDHPAIGWLGDDLDPNDDTLRFFTDGPYAPGDAPGSDAGLPPTGMENAMLAAVDDAARLVILRGDPHYGDAVLAAANVAAHRADQYVIIAGQTWRWDGATWTKGPDVAVGGLLRHPVFTETLIRRWISEAQRFQGTVQHDRQHPLLGSVQIKDMVIPSPANQGQYYIAVEDIVSKPALTLGGYTTQGAVPSANGHLHADVPGGRILLWSADGAGTDYHTQLSTLVVGDTVRVKQQGQNDWWDITLTAPVTVAANALATLTGTITVHGAAPADGVAVEVERRAMETQITHAPDPNHDPPVAGGTYTLPAMTAGDWLMSTGNPNDATGGWARVPGGVLTISIADTLYVKRTDTQLLVPATTHKDWMLVSRPGAAPVWVQPTLHDQIMGAVVERPSGLTGELLWSDLITLPSGAGGKDAGIRNPAAWPFVLDPQNPGNDMEDQGIYALPDVGQGVGTAMPAGYAATNLYVSQYDGDGALGGGKFLPDNVLHGGIIRLTQGALWADYRVIGRRDLPRQPGWTNFGGGATDFDVELVATSPGGHPDMHYGGGGVRGTDITVTYVFDPQGSAPNQKPGAIFVVADEHVIPAGAGGRWAGRTAHPGDLIRFLDTDGDHRSDTIELLAGPTGGQAFFATVATETPSAPGSVVLPPVLQTGALFVNGFRHEIWAYDGHQWQRVGHPQELPEWTIADAGKVLGLDPDSGDLIWRPNPEAPLRLVRQANAKPAIGLNYWADIYKPEIPVGSWFIVTEQINGVAQGANDPAAVWITTDGAHLDHTSWVSIPPGTVGFKSGDHEVTESYRPGGHAVWTSAVAGRNPVVDSKRFLSVGAGAAAAHQYRPVQSAPGGNGEVGIYTVGGHLRIEFWPMAHDNATNPTTDLLALHAGTTLILTSALGADHGQITVTTTSDFQVDTATGRHSVVWANIAPVEGSTTYGGDYHNVEVGVPLAGNIGDEYVNTHDRRFWVRDAAHWVERIIDSGVRLVPDETARLALDVPDGTLVVQQDTGWTWRYQAAYKGDAFWSPWRVFSDYVGAPTNGARDALAPHLHIGTLVSVGPIMYQYVTNPDTAAGQPPGVFIPFGDHVHTAFPPTEAPVIWLDRGLLNLGIKGTVDSNPVTNVLVNHPWDILITGQARSDTDLYLLFHTGNITTDNIDAPVATRNAKTAIGPWRVKAQAPFAIRIQGNVVGWTPWLIEFTGTDPAGHRIFDNQIVQHEASSAVLPAVGVEAVTGNLYVNRARFQMTRDV